MGLGDLAARVAAFRPAHDRLRGIEALSAVAAAIRSGWCLRLFRDAGTTDSRSDRFLGHPLALVLFYETRADAISRRDISGEYRRRWERHTRRHGSLGASTRFSS